MLKHWAGALVALVATQGTVAAGIVAYTHASAATMRDTVAHDEDGPFFVNCHQNGDCSTYFPAATAALPDVSGPPIPLPSTETKPPTPMTVPLINPWASTNAGLRTDFKRFTHVQDEPLYRLPNGAWISPSTVVQIRVSGPDRVTPDIQWSVQIDTTNGSTSVYFLTESASRTYADELAGRVNALRAEKKRP